MGGYSFLLDFIWKNSIPVINFLMTLFTLSADM
jgi:hypothetical protein